MSDPISSMVWDNTLLPPPAQSGNASLTFTIMAAPLYFRLNLTNGVGSVRATFLQVGEHSHSNITSGPFAPRGALDQELPFGSNSGAMVK